MQFYERVGRAESGDEIQAAELVGGMNRLELLDPIFTVESAETRAMANLIRFPRVRRLTPAHDTSRRTDMGNAFDREEGGA